MTERDRLLVIGIGNSLRRDDGAGLLLARGLADVWQAADRPVRLLLTHQLAPELAEDSAADDVAAVLFVDAALDDGGDCRLEPVGDADATPGLGHQVGPALVLLYAERLFGRRPPAWLLRVPGHDFAHGEGLSPATAAAVAGRIATADALWAAVTPPA